MAISVKIRNFFPIHDFFNALADGFSLEFYDGAGTQRIGDVLPEGQKRLTLCALI